MLKHDSNVPGAGRDAMLRCDAYIEQIGSLEQMTGLRGLLIAPPLN